MAAAGVGGECKEVGAQEGFAAGEGQEESAEGGDLVDQGEGLAGGEFGGGGGVMLRGEDREEAVAAAFVAAVAELPVDAEKPPLLARPGQQVPQEIGGRASG